MGDNILYNIKNYLEGSSRRHEILSDNVARSNVPGAKARDFSPEMYMNQKNPHASMNIATTNPAHIASIGPKGAGAYLAKDSWGVKPNGNNIHTEQQSHKIAKNAEQYKTAAKAYSAIFDILTSSLGSGR